MEGLVGEMSAWIGVEVGLPGHHYYWGLWGVTWTTAIKEPNLVHVE